MLTSYVRIMDAYRRKVRLEAQLSYRESDRRPVNEEYTWTRWRGEGERASERHERTQAQTAEHEEHAS